MIVDSDLHDMAPAQTVPENPPSYSDITNGQPGHVDHPKAHFPSDSKYPRQQMIPYNGPSSSSTVVQPTMLPSPTVYHYTNPHTQEHVVSLLPPDHPEMICLQHGEHIRQTRFGLLGVLAAVFWFPLGIGICLLDRKVTCKRCGTVVEEGLCR